MVRNKGAIMLHCRILVDEANIDDDPFTSYYGLIAKAIKEVPNCILDIKGILHYNSNQGSFSNS